MTSSCNGIRELWCRQLAGGSLSDDETRQLDQSIRDLPEVAAELGEDATSHALLLSLSDVQQTEEDFVQAVLERSQSAAASPSADNELPSEPASASPPPNSHGEPLLIPETAIHLSRRPQKHSPPWLALSLTLLLFACLGVMFWFQDRNAPRIVDTEPGTPPQMDHIALPNPAEDLRENESDQNTARPESTDLAAHQTELAPPGLPGDELAPQVADQGNRPGMTQAPEPPFRRRDKETDVAPRQDAMFATLTRAQSPVWEREDTVGTRLGDEAIRLFAGEIELTFDDGAVVTLEGPVEFQPRSSGQLLLRRGRLSATVPQPAIGFTVKTPTAEVVDLGTEFDVTVKETGASDVIVRKGEVEVGSSRPDGGGLRRWRLKPEGLNQAAFQPAAGPGRAGPLSATVKGRDGQFRGVISVNGRSAEFRSAAAFQSVRDRVQAEFQTSRESAQQQWQEFVDSMQQNMRGSMRLNGSEVQFGSMQDVMKLHDQMRQQLNQATGNSPQSNFRGSINVNGRVLNFTSREEYEAARRAAFGSAATFGAGDVLNPGSR
ncbi:MAG: FecR family protein [Planctomycetaceae bacterium]|nr:FecR family protein [Planctomycetaceae bacterium]